MEEPKDAGLFEDEAVFVTVEEDDTERYEIIARSEGDVAHVARPERKEVCLLDSVGNQATEQNGAVEQAGLPDCPRSSPSRSSLVPPGAASHFQSGKRIQMFFGTIVFAIVVIASSTRRSRDSGGNASPLQEINWDAGRRFVPYKRPSPAFARKNRRKVWKVSKTPDGRSSTKNSSEAWRGSMGILHRLLNENSDAWRMLLDDSYRPPNRSLFGEMGRLGPFETSSPHPLSLDNPQVDSQDPASPLAESQLLVRERGTSLSPSDASAEDVTTVLGTEAIMDDGAARTLSMGPTGASQGVESRHRLGDGSAKRTFRFRIDPNAGSHPYPADPVMEFLTNETFYQVIGAASEAPVFVNFFLRLCPSCPGEHPVRSRSWREYAAAVRALDVSVEVAAIDCLAHMDVCRDQLVTKFPHHRWYPRRPGGDTAGVAFPYRKTADDFMKFTRERLLSL